MPDEELLTEEIEDQTEDPSPDPDYEEPAEDTAEDATEPDEPEDQETPSDDGEAAPDLLSQIPEDYRELARKYGEDRVGGLKRSNTARFQELNDKVKQLEALKEQAEAAEVFNERFRNDPRGTIAELQKLAEKVAPTEPEEPPDPGPMPDPLMDPEGVKDWSVRSAARQKWELQQVQRQIDQKIQPLRQMYEEQTRQQARLSLRQQLEIQTDDEWSEFEQTMAELQQSPQRAAAFVRDHLRLKKGQSATVEKKKKRTSEALRGSEERTGLPGSAGTMRPKSTGNPMKDALAELKAEGMKLPPEFSR